MSAITSKQRLLIKKRQLEKDKEIQLATFKKIAFYPKVTIDGVLSVASKLKLALACCCAYFLLQNIPLFGLISVLDFASNGRSNAIARLLSSSNDSSIIAASKLAIGTLPIMTDLIIWGTGWQVNDEEKETLKNGLTTATVGLSIARFWYNLFFARDYLSPYLNPLYVLTVSERYLWLVRIVVLLEMIAASVILHIIEELTQKTGITTMLMIAYFCETMLKVIANVHLFSDFTNKMAAGFVLLLALISFIEYVTLNKVDKYYELGGSGSRFETKATTISMDSLMSISESLYISTMLRTAIANASHLLAFGAHLWKQLLYFVTGKDYDVYTHEKGLKWFMINSLAEKPLGRIIEKFLVEGSLTRREKWVLALIFCENIVLPLTSFVIMRTIMDPTGNAEELVKQDAQSRVFVKVVPKDRTFQKNYYKKIIRNCNVGSIMFFLASAAISIYGITPYHLIDVEEFVVNYVRILNIKNGLSNYKDIDLPPIMVTLKDLSKEIPLES